MEKVFTEHIKIPVLKGENMRGRPKKPRIVKNQPHIRQFSPRGQIGRPGYQELTTGEYEALRLSDFIGLNQRESAASMEVSQQTFSRVLKGARKGVSEALVLGKIIKIIDPAKVSKKCRKKGRKASKNPS